MQTDNLAAFESLYNTLSQKWSKPFDDHFNDDLRDELLESSVLWVLEAVNVYDPYSGVTNNIAEGMNTVIKRLNDWKELTIDSAVLSFHYLQVYYCHELLRGLCGTGIKQRHISASVDPSDVEIPKDVCDPDEIVSRVKAELTKRGTR